MIFENYQIINEGNKARFAVVDYDEFTMVKEVFDNPQKLEDYLDFLHVQKIKSKNEKRYTSEEAINEISKK